MTICADGTTMQIPTASWPKYQAMGATQGACPSNGNIKGGGNGGGSNGGSGDSLGKPNGGAAKPGAKITICHTPPENPKAPKVTMEILPSDWAAHQKHGDTQGPCAAPGKVIVPNKTIQQGK
jgi:hypothetical protein